MRGRFAAGGPSTPPADPGAYWTIASFLGAGGLFLLSSVRLGEAMKQPVQRRLAAILAADVAGYSRMMGEDEAGTAQALREDRAAADRASGAALPRTAETRAMSSRDRWSRP